MFPGINSIVIIGKRNIETVKNLLKKLKIRIIAEDTGGNQGRSVWFDTTDGSVVVSHTHGETAEMWEIVPNSSSKARENKRFIYKYILIKYIVI